MSIINPIHPLQGQSLSVHQIRHDGKRLKVILEHPDGGLISVPVSETSLEPPSPSIQIGEVTPRFDANKLQQLTVLVSVLGSNARTRAEDEKVINPKIDAKTASNTPNSTRSEQPSTRKINNSNSSAHRQNPRRKDVTKFKKGKN
ncbi:MAG: hypothetical protein N5P05_004321 (plasmid) [Chroococcopsis gigantea SAG 12.99]|nr:hypothetical protein [Chroococcopsis gigantea SAG 12.99]MDV2999161.1 hypothetical protein [Chroococcopsis gigantea SAG 12.99]MDV3000025.1 hypothetical protein [Chroococcopsis gigantea SAG 12.99]MDV3001153.1 hypothetical protein [Chroococcopsis gigantea SAG 12.99]MDV3001406.1 hypothetical protein [Chroococcopsis gigantea SAG 12.99]